MGKVALVTGGKGYLGSHLCKELKDNGWYVVILDRKDNKFVHSFYDKCITQTDIRHREKLMYVFDNCDIDVVFHLAGRIEVGESMKYPAEFWDVNVGGTSALIYAMEYAGVKKIIFSSSAAVYRKKNGAISEEDELSNNSVYGNTKLACEQMIKDSGFKYGILRYFNLAGSHPVENIGENHTHETHLIPKILENLNSFIINGDDYGTADGTCIRDYVHVCDVANAHLLAADYLDNNDSFTANLGLGKGHSIKEIIKVIEDELNLKVNYSIKERRSGDPDILIADISKAQKLLNYQPKYDIKDIIKTAYKWHLQKERV